MALEKFTVLICDDSLLIRKKLKEALEELNFQAIYEAQNGISAVEQVEKYKPRIFRYRYA